MKNRITSLLIILISIVTCFIVTPETALAAEKQINVPISTDYSEVTFKAEFEESGDYNVTLKSPSGEVFSFVSTGTNIYTCTITNVTAGSWFVDISAPSKLEIGKVTVSAKKSSSSGDISIGRDVLGLKIYFKNNSLVAEWTDETCPSILFEVTNLDNSECIIKESAKDYYFECSLPSKANNISVSVTPTRTNGISGATATYTFERVNSVNATVSFYNKYTTNLNEIPITAILNEPYGICVEVNGKVILEDETKAAGEYEFKVSLPEEGENLIRFFLVDENGNMISSDATYLKDVTYPELSLSAEYDGLTISESEYVISGHVSGHDTFTINGKEIDVGADGQFSYTCTLEPGHNLFSLLASDKAGNESYYNITLSVPTEEESSPPYILLIIGVVIIIIVFHKKPSRSDLKGENSNLEDFDDEDVGDSKKAFNKANNDVTDAFDYLDRIKDKEEVQETPVSPLRTDKFTIKEASRKEETPSQSKKLKRAKSKQKEDEDYIPSPFDVRERSKEKQKKKRFSALHIFRFVSNLGNIAVFLIQVIIIAVVCNFVLYLGYIPTGTMEPTIETDSIAVYNKLAYIEKTPSYGDIIAFKKNGEVHCKRIIGVAGDEISFSDGYVYRNGERVEEYYLDSDIETNSRKTFTVPDKCIFVLGDNRENSYDARYWDEPYVLVDDIFGKLLFSFPIPEF